MADKKYFFFKMEDDFFQKREVKKLRSIAGGDTFIIIYLKLILKSLKTGGKLYFEGIEDNFSDEIALEIDEKPENVKVTINYLLSKSLISEINENEYDVNDLGEKIDSKTSTALRVSRWREKNKEKLALQMNKNVTTCNKIVTESKSNIIESELKQEKESKNCYLNPKIRPSCVEEVEALYWKIYNNKHPEGTPEHDRHKAADMFNTVPADIWDHYTTIGWVYGKARVPIKNYHTVISQWISRDEKWGIKK
jgi:phage replisome organizer, putative, N-terminal region